MSEFITGSELAALSLYACLKKDGQDVAHFSELRRVGAEGISCKNYHLHRVRVSLTVEMLRSYVRFLEEKFPKMFLQARYLLEACADTSTMPRKLTLLRQVQSPPS